MRFAKAIASRTDDELIEIVTDPPEDWEPEAVDAAKAEMEKRGLRFESCAHPYRTLEQPRARTDDKAPPLEPGMKVVALLLGVFLTILGVLIGLAAMSSYTKKGKRRTGTDFATWTAIGAALSTVLFLMARRC